MSITRVEIKAMKISKIVVSMEGSAMGLEKTLEWGSSADHPTEKVADFGTRGAPAARIVLRLEGSTFPFGAINDLRIFATGKHVDDPDKPLVLDPGRNERQLLADAQQSILMVLDHADGEVSRTHGEGKAGALSPRAAVQALEAAMAAAKSSRAPSALRRAVDDAVAARTDLVREGAPGTKSERRAQLGQLSQAITSAHALLYEIEQDNARTEIDDEDEQTASSSEEVVRDYGNQVFRKPADAPAALLDDIYEFLEGEIEHAGAGDDTELSEYQEKAERLFQGQHFASEEWDTWFDNSIREIQDHLHGHQSHTDGEDDEGH